MSIPEPVVRFTFTDFGSGTVTISVSHSPQSESLVRVDTPFDFAQDRLVRPERLEFGGIGEIIGNDGKNGRSMNRKSRLKATGIGAVLVAIGYLRNKRRQAGCHPLDGTTDVFV